VDEAYAAYLRAVQEQRAELGESMVALQGALDLPAGLGPTWRGRVRAALTELAHDLRDHVELTEAAGGFYDDIRTAAPRLNHQVEEQLAEHAALLAEVERLLAERDDGVRGADAVVAHREAATRLLEQLVRHRQRGSDLTFEAYAVDLGGSG
jgi:hypothetical protein